jgi:8-oxo-dGTP diphosphatase
MKKRIRVVGCIVRKGNEILLLYRSATETNPSLWGIPAGKVEKGESDIQTALREIFEETGISLSPESVEYLGMLPIAYEAFIVDFPIFIASFQKKPEITLSPGEHIDFQWITPRKALQLPNLMKDVDVIIKDYCIEKLKIID